MKEYEQNWDATRLVYDEEGRLWYNQTYEEVRSEKEPGRTILRPIAGSRPFDNKEGYTPVKVYRDGGDQ